MKEEGVDGVSPPATAPQDNRTAAATPSSLRPFIEEVDDDGTDADLDEYAGEGEGGAGVSGDAEAGGFERRGPSDDDGQDDPSVGTADGSDDDRDEDGADDDDSEDTEPDLIQSLEEEMGLGVATLESLRVKMKGLEDEIVAERSNIEGHKNNLQNLQTQHVKLQKNRDTAAKLVKNVEVTLKKCIGRLKRKIDENGEAGRREGFGVGGDVGKNSVFPEEDKMEAGGNGHTGPTGAGYIAQDAPSVAGPVETRDAGLSDATFSLTRMSDEEPAPNICAGKPRGGDSPLEVALLPIHASPMLLERFWSLNERLDSGSTCESGASSLQTNFAMLFPSVSDPNLITKMMEVTAAEILALDSQCMDGMHRIEGIDGTILDVTVAAVRHTRASSFPLKDARGPGEVVTVVVPDSEGGSKAELKSPAEASGNDDNATESDKLASQQGVGGLDPNVTLCPYELGGTCADPSCPYQHLDSALAASYPSSASDGRAIDNDPPVNDEDAAVLRPVERIPSPLRPLPEMKLPPAPSKIFWASLLAVGETSETALQEGSKVLDGLDSGCKEQGKAAGGEGSRKRSRSSSDVGGADECLEEGGGRETVRRKMEGSSLEAPLVDSDAASLVKSDIEIEEDGGVVNADVVTGTRSVHESNGDAVQGVGHGKDSVGQCGGRQDSQREHANGNALVQSENVDEHTIDEKEACDGTGLHDDDDDGGSRGAVERLRWENNDDYVALPLPPSTSSHASFDEESAIAADEGNGEPERDVSLTGASSCRFWWSDSFDVARSERCLSDPHGGISHGLSLSLLDWLNVHGGFVVVLQEEHAKEGTSFEHQRPQEPQPMSLRYANHISPANSVLDIIAFFGRILDCVRVAIHGGRMDIAYGLLFLGTESIQSTKHDCGGGKKNIFTKVLAFAKECTDTAFYCNASSCGGPIASLFESQLGLLVLSEFMRAWHVHTDSSRISSSSCSVEGSPDAKPRPCADELLWDELLGDCWRAFGGKMAKSGQEKGNEDDVPTAGNDLSGQGLGARVQKLFNSLRLAEEGELGDPSAAQRSLLSMTTANHQKEKPLRSHPKGTEMRQITELVRIARSDSFQHALSSAPWRVLDEVLEPCWHEVRNYLRNRSLHQTSGTVASANSSLIGMSPISERPTVHPTLTAIALMGTVTFSVISSILSPHADYARDRPNEHGKPGTPRSSRMHATLTALDAFLHRMVTQLRKGGIGGSRNTAFGAPMMADLLLSPLHALCVSLSVYLGLYGKAQLRLEGALSAGAQCKEEASAIDSNEKSRESGMAMMVYSELLWSQLVVLRSLFPSPPAQTDVLNHGKKAIGDNDGKHEDPVTNITDDFDGIVSLISYIGNETALDCATLSQRLVEFGVCPHNLSLHGDRDILSAALFGRPNPGKKKRKVMDNIRGICHALVGTPPLSSGVATPSWQTWVRFVLDVLNPSPNDMEHRLPAQLPQQLQHHFDWRWCLNSADFGGYCRSGRGLSNFPMSLCLKSDGVNQLLMARCHLHSLPETFGLHFRDLKFLDLSQNNLSELPASISLLVSLKTLNASSNSLTALPPQIGNMSALRKLYASHNQIIELPQSLCKCTKLEDLDVGHNGIQSIPSELPLALLNLQTLNLDGNPVADSTAGQETDSCL